jgi:ribonuclease HII
VSLQYVEDTLLSDVSSDELLLSGVDEVGRGALFGPVVAASVVLPLSDVPKLVAIGVKDSKKLTAKQRQQLVFPIQQVVYDWQIASCNVTEIDRLNILQASLLAMKRTILQLKTSPDLCLVDGNIAISNLPIPQKTIVKGDASSPTIAAASILAKVWRDELIISLGDRYPEYNLAANKGYPTLEHRLAIQKYGVSDKHRRSFRSCL